MKGKKKNGSLVSTCCNGTRRAQNDSQPTLRLFTAKHLKPKEPYKTY